MKHISRIINLDIYVLRAYLNDKHTDLTKKRTELSLTRGGLHPAVNRMRKKQHNVKSEGDHDERLRLEMCGRTFVLRPAAKLFKKKFWPAQSARNS